VIGTSGQVIGVSGQGIAGYLNGISSDIYDIRDISDIPDIRDLPISDSRIPRCQDEAMT
jgi:hypothetical protein